MNQLIATIDFGTNTARLLIAEKNNSLQGFKQIYLEREIVRMGGGFSREIGLSCDAIERGVACLRKFSNSMQRYKIDSVRAVATSAVRDAKNNKVFLDRVQNETGIVLEIIDGEQEGSLTLHGVMSGLDTKFDSLLLFDVGGGSTEFTIMQNGKTLFVKSLPLGVVRLTEGKNSPQEMLDKVNKELCLLQCEMNSKGIKWSCDSLIGTAGTATTLAAISMEMTDYDYRRVNNCELTLETIKQIYQKLSSLTLSERLALPGLEKGREDLIIAGCLITIQAMEMFGYSCVKVSDYGLLEGLVVSF